MSISPPAVIDGAEPSPAAGAPVRSAPADRVDASRGFGAHLRTPWWRGLLVLVTITLLAVVIQILASVVGIAYEMLVNGVTVDELLTLGLTPSLLLATNLSWAVTALVSLLSLRWVGGVPWRAGLRVGRRFRWGALAAYVAGFAVLIILGSVVLYLTDPQPLGELKLTGTVLAFMLIVALTTPLQAAGEEVTFRGVVFPVVGSWIRPRRTALAVGLLVSSLAFGSMHFAADPWLFTYYTMMGGCMAVMAIAADGLEAPIAFHVANNVVLFLAGAPAMDDQGVQIDRSAGAGGPWVLIMIGLDVLAVVLVVLIERRRRGRAARRLEPGAGALTSSGRAA